MTPSTKEPDVLGKGLKDLNLTHEELNKFEKAFKDPEFLKLFEEYAKEVSDPKVKAETDQYLRELEFQGRAEDVYGKGVQLLSPTPALVLKSKVLPQKGATASGDVANDACLPVGQKVFINVCTSDKVDRYSLKDAKDTSGRSGRQLSIPLTLGPKRMGTDKQGQPAAVYDFAVHPDSVEFATRSTPVFSTLAETALEQVEKVSHSRLSRNWRRLNTRYKATEGCTEPPVQCIRTAEGGESVGGRLRPQAHVPAADVPGAKTAPKTAEGPAAAEAVGEAAGKGPSSRSGFSFDKSKDKAGRKAGGQQSQLEIKDPAQPGHRHAGGAVTPEWSLVHRGETDLAEAWGDAGRGLTLGASVPKELLVRVTMPDVTSAAAVDLDVGDKRLTLKVPNRYHLDVPLPYVVDETKGKAKFDKARKQLEITLPVLPPPPPPRPAAPPPVVELQQPEPAAEDPEPCVGGPACGDVLEAATTTSGAVCASATAAVEVGVDGIEGAAAVTLREAPAAVKAVDESSAAFSGATEPEAVPSSSGAGVEGDDAARLVQLTDNERRWRELHARQHPQAEAAEGADADAAGASPDGVAEACEAAGAAPSATAATASAVEEVAPTVLLKPRLRRDLAMELD